MSEANSGHWFEALADHMGSAYLRYSFTKGTEQEVDVLVDLLGLEPGDRVVDVGCGPGRHALALAERGMTVLGVDISARFVEVATDAAATAGLSERASFIVGDARDLGGVAAPGTFDAAISLCQGAFGLAGGAGARNGLPARELDEPIRAGIGQAVRPGGRVAVSAFSSYFMMRHLEDHDTFDVEAGVNHEVTEVRDELGAAVPADLWTSCFTPRELRLLARMVGLEPQAVHGVTPGDYGDRPPSADRPEFLLVALRPG